VLLNKEADITICIHPLILHHLKKNVDQLHCLYWKYW